MRTVYLAGTMEGRSYEECVTERNVAKMLLNQRGIRVLDPLRGKEYLAGKIINRDEKPNGVYIGEIIARDKYDLERSDLLLILTGDVPSDGTWLEYGYAKYMLDIPVVLIAPLRIGKNGWSNHEATYIAKSLEDAVKWIVDYFFYVEPY